MIKKILILSGLFVGLGAMAIYTASKIQPPIIIDEGDFEPIVVLELFTSQGCSSCPPADMLLEKVKKQYPKDVFALSYHVDYWNYIGWEDPFSDSRFTKKQREYNVKFRYSSNYTPEMVVNGREHFVGSNGTKLGSKIKEYHNKKVPNQIKINTLDNNANSVEFSFEIKGSIEDKLLRAVLVLDERTTVVKRGENRNRTLKNSNIVVKELYYPINGASGDGKIEIPRWVKSNEKLQLVLLLENSELDITGATKYALN